MNTNISDNDITKSPDHLNTAISAALQAGKAILEIYHSSEFNV